MFDNIRYLLIMSKNAIATVFYPKAKDYIGDFLASVKNQTLQDFVLIIFNDGLDNINFFLNGVVKNFVVIDVEDTPALIRINLIKYLLEEGFNKVLFADCDDIMADNRLEFSSEMLNKYDVIVNDVFLNGKEIKFNNYFSNRIQDLQIINLGMLYLYNFMGLSNTAARVNILDPNMKINNKNLKAFDWFLWTKVLLKNKKVLFSNKSLTEYRIHENNVSNLTRSISKKQALEGIKVKKEHYEQFSLENKYFKSLHRKFILLESMASDIMWLNDYVKLINKKKFLFPFWWEKIIIPEYL